MAVQRTLTGLILTAVILAGIFINPLTWILPVLFCAAALLGVHEYCNIASRREHPPLKWISLIICAALLIDALRFGLGHFLEIAILAAILIGVAYVIFKDYVGSISGSASTMFANLYVTLPLALGILIFQMPHGRFIIGFIMGVVFMTDTGAYITGMKLGKHKLSPRLSPNKSIEGAIGGFLFGVITGLIAFAIMSAMKIEVLTLYEIIILSAFFSVAGQIGDLVESGFKRDADVKDSGNTLSGHGGILDLTDGLIFCLPLMYVYLVIFPR